jgi:PleD family two-component response regulator
MRILIVDDEADVLQAIMAIVKAVPGHDVRVAANAQKAMDHAGTLGGVELLITDVVMEPVDGILPARGAAGGVSGDAHDFRERL